jgi:hypothetical protein
MKYILVRTYGNGQHMNKVHPVYFNWLSQAERACAELNQQEHECTSDKWIPMPITEFVGSVW